MNFAVSGARSFRASCSVARMALAGVALAGMFASAPALAQLAPSRVVPQSVAPVETTADGAIALPETRTSGAPAGADGLIVQLARITVEGADAALEPEILAITAPLADKSVRVSEIYAAAAQIEALYVRNGKVLARAMVPPQQLVNGSVARIRILDGFIESVDASAVPARIRSAVAKRAARLVGRKGLTLKQIERHLLIAGRVPGVVLESLIVPGKEAGGAVLVLEARWHALAGQVSTDNRLGASYRNANVDGQIVLNSVLGTAEQIYAMVSTAPDFGLFESKPLRRVAGVGVITPIGTNGLTLNSEYIRADTNPKVPADVLPISGTLDRFALRLRYPIGLTRREIFNLFATFDVLGESQAVRGFNLTLSRDRLRFVTLGLDWTRATAKGGSSGVEVSIAQGLDILKARDGRDAVRSGIVLSRFGSAPDFTRIAGSANVRRPIWNTVEAAVTVRGQVSLSGALPSSAQFALDASDALSGFFLGSLSVDSGATLRGELALPLMPGKTPGKANLTPYIFTARGWGHLSRPTALELPKVNGWSFGTGLRAGLRSGLSAYAELARSGANVSRNSTRLSGGISFRF